MTYNNDQSRNEQNRSPRDADATRKANQQNQAQGQGRQAPSGQPNRDSENQGRSRN